MSIYNFESPVAIRRKMFKQMIVAFRNIVIQNEVTIDTKDSAAFIYFLIKEIKNNADITAKTWEKRGYWLKSDKFRRELEWLDYIESSLEYMLDNDDWNDFPELIIKMTKKIENLKINISKNDMKNKPWKNAFLKYRQKKIENSEF